MKRSPPSRFSFLAADGDDAEESDVPAIVSAAARKSSADADDDHDLKTSDNEHSLAARIRRLRDYLSDVNGCVARWRLSIGRLIDRLVDNRIAPAGKSAPSRAKRCLCSRRRFK